jgi:hypothetical protein
MTLKISKDSIKLLMTSQFELILINKKGTWQITHLIWELIDITLLIVLIISR